MNSKKEIKNLVFKYALRFSSDGIPTHKMYIKALHEFVDDSSLNFQYELLVLPADANYIDFNDAVADIYYIPIKESANWNIYFDAFELDEAIYNYAREKFKRIRQDTLSWKVWETTKLLEDN